MLLQNEITDQMYSSMRPEEYNDVVMTYPSRIITGEGIRSAMANARESAESDLYGTKVWAEVGTQDSSCYLHWLWDARSLLSMY